MGQRVVGERSSAITNDLDDLGVLVSAAYGLDTSWMSAARCRSWDGEPDDDEPYPLGIPTPWQFDYEQVVVTRIGKKEVVLEGKEMIKVALMHCYGCPAQYVCARYGVEARCRAGTYGMRISDLRWLQSQPDALELIAIADDLDIPMQRYVAEMRKIRAAEESAQADAA